MAGTLTVSGLAAGLLSGQNTIGPVTMTGTVVIGQRTDVTLLAGDNTIAVPASAAAVLIIMGSSGTAQLKLRTNLNATDVGTSFGPTGFVVFPLFTGTTSLIVNAAGAGGTLEATFI